MSTARSRGAVDDDAEVELAGDLQALLDQDALTTFWPSGPVWWVTSCMPRICAATFCGLVGALDDLDAAALAAAAGVDLRLDDD